MVFESAGCGKANVVIMLERRVDEILKLFVLEHLPPFQVSKGGFRRRLRCLLRRRSTICTGNVYARPFIVGPYSAARKKQHYQRNCDQSSHLSQPPTGVAAEQKD